jgi:hypothetical protein
MGWVKAVKVELDVEYRYHPFSDHDEERFRSTLWIFVLFF